MKNKLISDTTQKWTDERVGTEQQSCYIRKTWMLSAKSILKLPKIMTCIRFFDERESQELYKLIKKRNVFARHSWENNFYLQRIEDLANTTVIEIFRPGNPRDMNYEAQKIADLIEKLAILSSTLIMSRKMIQRKLAISSHRRSVFDITIGPKFWSLKSKSMPEQDVQGITIDERFCSRFESCGFPQLAFICLTCNDIADHVMSAINWLFESRQEPILSASIVKTSIALESLLISNESEPLAKSLSERTAFILSSDPDIRNKVSQIVKTFYDARSGVVHGSRKKLKKLTPGLVEGMDRLIVLLCLIIASNSNKWNSIESLIKWFEGQRWGAPASDIHIPFSNTYLLNAINLCNKEVAIDMNKSSNSST